MRNFDAPLALFILYTIVYLFIIYMYNMFVYVEKLKNPLENKKQFILLLT